MAARCGWAAGLAGVLLVACLTVLLDVRTDDRAAARLVVRFLGFGAESDDLVRLSAALMFSPSGTLFGRTLDRFIAALSLAFRLIVGNNERRERMLDCGIIERSV